MLVAKHIGLRRRNAKPSVLLVVCVLSIFVMRSATSYAQPDGGSTASPDLEVGGFTVFGTNTTGATSVTSGWGNVYMDGSLQIRSNLHVNATIISSNKIEVNKLTLTQRDQILTNGASIQPVSSYIRIRGDTTPVSGLADPQISAGAPGQLITLQGVANSVSVTITNGAGLRTKLEKSFTLGEFDTIQFIYDESNATWVEINRSNNRW